LAHFSHDGGRERSKSPFKAWNDGDSEDSTKKHERMNKEKNEGKSQITNHNA
jgi:hypothetical protein